MVPWFAHSTGPGMQRGYPTPGLRCPAHPDRRGTGEGVVALLLLGVRPTCWHSNPGLGPPLHPSTAGGMSSSFCPRQADGLARKKRPSCIHFLGLT